MTFIAKLKKFKLMPTMGFNKNMTRKCSEFKLLLGNNRGMSLMEILIALTLLGITGAFVGGKLFDSLNEGKQSATRININNLSDRLKEYRRHCGIYPTTDQGLEALVSKPSSGKPCERYNSGGYIESGKVPKDAWDNEFIYESDGKTFKIISFGANGEDGGEGFDANIDSSKF